MGGAVLKDLTTVPIVEAYDPKADAGSAVTTASCSPSRLRFVGGQPLPPSTTLSMWWEEDRPTWAAVELPSPLSRDTIRRATLG